VLADVLLVVSNQRSKAPQI